MTPLSALGTLAPARMQGGLPVGSIAEPSSISSIPFSELETLSPGIQPQSVQPAHASFDGLLQNLVGEVTAKQSAAGDAVNGLLANQNVSLHQVMIGMEEASVSFQLMVEVRNRLLESYQELMRMQI